MNILAVDVGTTSMRGILFSKSGTVLASASRLTPMIYTGQWIEQDPDVFTGGLVSICTEIAALHPVDAISLTAFRSAPALVDRQEKALTRFIMWQDTRNKDICESLSPHNSHVHQKSGAVINTVFTATKIRWFRDHMPDIYQKAYKAMVVPDYMMLFMTGEFVTDHTYGSRSSLMNLRTLCWDDDLLEIFGVDKEKLCSLIPQGTVAGTVTEGFARLTGIPAGVPVVSAGGDQQCGALGLGVLDERTLEINSGTGSYIISLIGEPNFDNQSLICNVSAIQGKYTLESGVLASAAALNWLMRTFYPDIMGEPPDYEAFNRLAASSPPGANGLYCLPHFQGCGTRRWDPDARAGFLGFTLSHTRGDMARALYEGICGEIVKSVQALPDICRRAEQVHIAGGLTGSGIFNRILCDMLDRPLIKAGNAQATAIGAFVSAGVALHVFPDHAAGVKAARAGDATVRYTPDPQTARLYRNYLSDSEALFDSLSAFKARKGDSCP